MSTLKIDTASVTINITAHTEGYYLYRSIRSALACAQQAEIAGIRTVINVHLDTSDKVTANVAKEFERRKLIKVYSNNFGDPSASRNFLIEKTLTKYVLVMDGDDLFSEDFIVTSFQVAEAYGKPCIVSAEKIFKFSHDINRLIHIAESTIDKPEIKTALFETNLYVSENLIATEIFKNCKYEPSTGNYGFEDWHWGTRAIAAGYEFLVAGKTAFFYRQKPDDQSLLRAHTSTNTVLRHTPLFDPVTFKRLPCREYYPPENVIEPEVTPSTLLIHATKHYIKSKKIGHKAYTGVRLLKSAAHASVDWIRGDVIYPEQIGDIKIATKKVQITDKEKKVWNKLNAIEPIIRFDSTNLDGFTDYNYTFEHSLVTAYYNFCKQYADNNFTDVVFVPWINRGGADLAIVDLVQRLSKMGRNVLVITTTGIDSQWGEKITKIPNATLIQSHDPLFRYLDHNNIKLFFLRLVQNWSIKTMTVMNSSIGFELVERFGSAIKNTGCKIIVHNYAFPSNEGLIVDAFPALSACLENVDAIIVDSNFHKNEFQEIYGYPESQILEVPLMVSSLIKPNKDGVTKRILFANRIAREKRPDIAIQAVKTLASKGIVMDVYGTVDEVYAESIDFYHSIDEIDNITFRGTFESSLSLDFTQYDICLMPSLYEGTPRIVLEALKAGLYVVCSDVGGMPEVLSQPQSGSVLPVTSSANQFASAISDYYDSPKLHDMKNRHAANKNVLKKHDQTYYNACIDEIYAAATGERSI